MKEKNVKKKRNHVKRNIRVKLVISFLLLTMTLTILVSLFSYIISFRIIKNKISESFSLTLDYICVDISDKLKYMYSLTDYVFINQEIKDAIECGTQKTLEAADKTIIASNALTKYVIPQFYENVNRITIVGFTGFRMQNINNYSDSIDDGLSKYYEEWKNLAIDAKGQFVWGGLITRKLNPYRDDSNEIREAILIRTIKNSNFTDDIGVMYVSISPRLFLNQIQSYHQNYPNYEDCNIFILDDKNNIINPEECSFSQNELETILNSNDSFETTGFLSKAHGSVVFEKNISNGWRLVGTIPTSLFLSGNDYIFNMSILIFPICILVCGLIWLYISVGIFKPIHNIGEFMQHVALGESNLRVKVSVHDEIGQLANNLNNMLDHLDSLNQANMEKELRLIDATYQAKQAQINPHFIYNTLNSIRWMAVMINAENIKNAIDALWVIAKYNTNGRNEYFSTVKDEVDIVKQYIYLQKLSYPGKFDVLWDVSEETFNCQCIKFFLQPLVENSIIHGSFPKEDECLISISIYVEGEQLVFNVYDDGIGMDETTLENQKDAAAGKAPSGHVGLPNIFERLRHVYGDKCSINISSQHKMYTNIMIVTPLIRLNHDSKDKGEI